MVAFFSMIINGFTWLANAFLRSGGWFTAFASHLSIKTGGKITGYLIFGGFYLFFAGAAFLYTSFVVGGIVTLFNLILNYLSFISTSGAGDSFLSSFYYVLNNIGIIAGLTTVLPAIMVALGFLVMKLLWISLIKFYSIYLRIFDSAMSLFS